jgi:hypothetical protein
MKTNIHFWSYLAQFVLEWEMFQTEVIEKIKTRILSSIIFLMCRFWDNVEKHSSAGQSTDGDMAHAHCVLDALGYIYILRICNTFFFSAAPNVALYIHCLSCYLLYLMYFS